MAVIFFLFLASQVPSEAEETEAAWEAGGLEGYRRLLERKRDEWKNVPLNVAVIGNSGVGKSSFINAIRGVTADDKGAAKVGVTKTTIEIRSYPHPDNMMMKFWELPGVGTNQFSRSTYLDDIDVDRFDFFLLLTAGSFTENDTWLGNEFRKRHKKYLFLRTKIANDISDDKREHPGTHNEEAVIDKIRQDITNYLRASGCGDVPVFLIDNYKLNKFEFEKLKQQVIKDFYDEKRSALIFSLLCASEEMIRLKMAELRSRIWRWAALSAAGAAVPLPGLSVMLDIVILTTMASFYYGQLGLDSESRQRYVRLYSANPERMRSTVVGALGERAGGGITGDDMKSIVLVIIARSSLSLAASAVGTAAKIYLPLLGSLIAAPLSLGATYLALKLILDKFEKTSIEVMQFLTVSSAMSE